MAPVQVPLVGIEAGLSHSSAEGMVSAMVMTRRHPGDRRVAEQEVGRHVHDRRVMADGGGVVPILDQVVVGGASTGTAAGAGGITGRGREAQAQRLKENREKKKQVDLLIMPFKCSSLGWKPCLVPLTS